MDPLKNDGEQDMSVNFGYNAASVQFFWYCFFSLSLFLVLLDYFFGGRRTALGFIFRAIDYNFLVVLFVCN